MIKYRSVRNVTHSVRWEGDPLVSITLSLLSDIWVRCSMLISVCMVLCR